MSEENHPAPVSAPESIPASTPNDTAASRKPSVAVDGSYDWHVEAESGEETGDEDAPALRDTLARLEKEMANYMEKSAQVESAVNEAREDRAALQAQIVALAALVHKKLPPQ